MPTAVQAAFLGIVQGLTEFLPVSSSAHLILARAFFGFDGTRFGLAFDVACHVGTLMAVAIYFRQELSRMVVALPSLLRPRREKWARMIWLLVAGTIPAVVVGLLFGSFIEDHLRTVPLAATTLSIGAIGLFWAERAGRKTRDEHGLTFGEAL